MRTKDPLWRQASFFWAKIYGLVFAMGIATGIVQEFEFGTNWADYSRFVGNVFGSLLAAEGIFAFFLEGGFLGLMLFGGNRLGPGLWLGATFLVVFGAHFSALWILMANSWMQTPQGYEIADDPVGRPGVDDRLRPGPVHAVLHAPPAAHLGRVVDGRGRAGAQRQRLVPAQQAPPGVRPGEPDPGPGFFAVLAFSQAAVFGANMAIEVTHYQPVKLAAMEGVWQCSRAPRCTSWAGSTRPTRPRPASAIPCLLSFLAYQDPQADGHRADLLPAGGGPRSTSCSRSTT